MSGKVEADFINLELGDTKAGDHHNARLGLAFGRVAQIDL